MTEPSPTPAAPTEAPAEPTYTFTVFTSTRNRAHTLERPFRSLMAQTFRDLEWLVIDNDSTDATPSLIEHFAAEADFPVRYVRQRDRGKHGSLNRAVPLARGELFLTLDSDDAFLPHALERYLANWQAIPESERAGFTGVTGLCVDPDGQLIGTRFPRDPLDSDSSEVRYRYKVRGEKRGFHRTDVLRAHPMPEIEGYRGQIPFTVMYAQIARRYRTRYVNEAMHMYWTDQPDRLSRGAGWAEAAHGHRLEARSVIDGDIAYFPSAPGRFVQMGVKYSLASFHAGLGVREQAAGLSSGASRALWAATLPVGWLAYRLDRSGYSDVVRRVRRVLG